MSKVTNFWIVWISLIAVAIMVLVQENDIRHITEHISILEHDITIVNSKIK